MKTLTTFFDCSQDIFLIEFNAKSSGIIFKNDVGTLGEIIRLYGKHGIFRLSRYEPAKMRFKKMNKNLISTLFSWDTDSIIEMKKLNFIK